MKRLIATVVTAAAIACDDGTGPEPFASGSLSVRLSGALTDVFSVSGARPARNTSEVVTFVEAVPIPSGSNRLAISAFRGRDGNRQDLLTLYVANASTGSHPADGELILGNVRGTMFPEHVFVLVSGTVQVTTVSARRIQGTFSAVAVRRTFGFPFDPSPDTLTLSMGQFDAPIRQR